MMSFGEEYAAATSHTRQTTTRNRFNVITCKSHKIITHLKQTYGRVNSFKGEDPHDLLRSTM